MKTYSPPSAQIKLYEIMKRVISSQNPVRIADKNGSIIIMDESNYEGMMETIYLLGVPGLLESLKESEQEFKRGEFYTHDEVFGLE